MSVCRISARQQQNAQLWSSSLAADLHADQHHNATQPVQSTDYALHHKGLAAKLLLMNAQVSLMDQNAEIIMSVKVKNVRQQHYVIRRLRYRMD